MAVLYNPGQSTDLEMSTLDEDELSLISHNPSGGKKGKGKTAPAISLKEVAALPLILPSRPNAFRILLEGEMMALGRRPEVLLEVDGLNAILNLVKEGMGHAVLPSYTLSNFDNPETFTVQFIHSPRIMSQLMLVWSARRPTTQTQRKADGRGEQSGAGGHSPLATLAVFCIAAIPCTACCATGTPRTLPAQLLQRRQP